MRSSVGMHPTQRSVIGEYGTDAPFPVVRRQLHEQGLRGCADP